MKRAFRVGTAVAGAAALGAAGAVVLGGTADAAKVSVPATYVMYANVDAAGDLGSNAGATGAGVYGVPGVYYVTFSKPIGACAPVAQVGKAGGSDNIYYAETSVRPESGQPNAVLVNIYDPSVMNVEQDPFVLTVTCRK